MIHLVARRPRWPLGRDATLFLISSLPVGVAFGVFFLLYNLYLADLHFSTGFIGLVQSVTTVAGAGAALPMGWLCDRWGRKPVLLVGTYLSGAGSLGMIASGSGPVILMASVVAGAGAAGVFVAGAPFMLETTKTSQHMGVFSFFAVAGLLTETAGNALGGFLPGWLGLLPPLHHASSVALYRAAMLLAGLLSVPSVVPLHILHEPARQAAAMTLGGTLTGLRRNSIVVRLAIYQALDGFGPGLIIPFINIFLVNVRGLSVKAYGTLTSVEVLCIALATLAVPLLVRRLGRVPTLALTDLLSVPFMIVLAFSHNWILLGAAFLIRAMLKNMSTPIRSLLAVAWVSESERATANSVMTMAWQGANALSTVIGGWLIAAAGWNATFGAAIVLYALVGGLVWVWFRKKDREDEAGSAGLSVPDIPATGATTEDTEDTEGAPRVEEFQ